MWRDRILEVIEAKGIRTKFIAGRTGLSEKTVKRILQGKAKTPYVSNVLEIGAAVGLSPVEIFSETGLVIGDQDLTALQAKVDMLSIELALVNESSLELKGTIAALTAELDLLRIKLEHKEELLKHKDEIIDLLRAKNN